MKKLRTVTFLILFSNILFDHVFKLLTIYTINFFIVSAFDIFHIFQISFATDSFGWSILAFFIKIYLRAYLFSFKMVCLSQLEIFVDDLWQMTHFFYLFSRWVQIQRMFYFVVGELNAAFHDIFLKEAVLF